MPANHASQQASRFSAKYWAFRVAAVVIPLVPLWISDPLARLAGLAIYAVAPGMRRKARANLARIPGLERPTVLERTCRQAFQHLALNYIDFFRTRTEDARRIEQEYTVLREELFHQALARGKGLIVVSAHLGNWEIAVSRMGMIGVPITIPAERLKPERLFALSCRLREHHGVRIVPVDRRDSLREMLAALARNEIVLMAIDRDVIGSGVAMSLFGAPAPIPTGGVLLARHSGATVLWASSWRVGRGRAVGGFEEIAPSEPASATSELSDGQAALRRALRPQVDLIERFVTRHPEQWVAVFTDIWPEHAGAGEAASSAAPSNERDDTRGAHDVALADRS
ncbi:MAG TPA: hypothetical protein VGR57_07855 [Ktedonobacterales bacterium]|nr:hypothetical protein [Ktedonobacterales bacterium]